MITIDKIKIYLKYKGDVDGWARIGTEEEKARMNDDDWFLIRSFIQDINLIKNGLASDSFASSVSERLRENCDSQETIQALENMPLL